MRTWVRVDIESLGVVDMSARGKRLEFKAADSGRRVSAVGA